MKRGETGWWAYDVGELGFGDEVLCFGSDEFLLERHELGALWLFVFEFLDFVGNLGFVVSARLHRALCVANLLQDTVIEHEFSGSFAVRGYLVKLLMADHFFGRRNTYLL